MKTLNELINLQDLFSSSILRIPDYQRGYSWEEEQLKDFWNDLSNLRLGRTHYMGVITLETVKKEKYEKWDDDLWAIDQRGLKPYYIIDGHQRILTSIILIKVIIDKMDKSNINILSSYKREAIIEKYLFINNNDNINFETYLFGYEKDDPSYEFYKTDILGQHSTNNQDIRTLYTKNLNDAKKFFEGKINEFDVEKLEELFKKVTLYLKFNVYEVNEELDALIVFEAMNNRGKKLSNLEILKNRLIYLSTLLENNSERKPLRDSINQVWRRIYEYLGESQGNLQDDKFLEQHWKMYFDYSRKGKQDYRQFLLKEYFIVENLFDSKSGNNSGHSRGRPINKDDIKKYIDSLYDSIPAYYYIHFPNDSPYDPIIKDWLLKLNRLNNSYDSQFTPLIMSILIKYGKENPGKVIEVLEGIERFIFLLIKVLNKRSNFEDTSFFRLAKSVYFNEKSPKDIISELEILINKNFGWEKFRDTIKYDTNYHGFYYLKGLKYLLFEYETSLQKKFNERAKINWDDWNKEKYEETIEHIYPQNPNENEECWNSNFGKYDESQKEKLRNSLGNLLIISRAKNSTEQNFCFERKKQDENGKGYYNGTFSEIEVSRKKDWGPIQILERGIELLEFMEKHWEISLGNREQKIEILDLEFLEEDVGSGGKGG